MAERQHDPGATTLPTMRVALRVVRTRNRIDAEALDQAEAGLGHAHGEAAIIWRDARMSDDVAALLEEIQAETQRLIDKARNLARKGSGA